VGGVAGELPPVGRGTQVLRQRIVAQLQRLHPLVVLLCGQVMEDQNLVSRDENFESGEWAQLQRLHPLVAILLHDKEKHFGTSSGDA